jgi:hypothetical protein
MFLEHRALARDESLDLRPFIRNIDRELVVSGDELPAIGGAAEARSAAEILGQVVRAEFMPRHDHDGRR